VPWPTTRNQSLNHCFGWRRTSQGSPALNKKYTFGQHNPPPPWPGPKWPPYLNSQWRWASSSTVLLGAERPQGALLWMKNTHFGLDFIRWKTNPNRVRSWPAWGLVFWHRDKVSSVLKKSPIWSKHNGPNWVAKSGENRLKAFSKNSWTASKPHRHCCKPSSHSIK